MDGNHRSHENEKRFARANERAEDVSESLSIEPVAFLCECSALRCTEIVRVTLESYREVREKGGFLLSPGHDNPHVEAVVDNRDVYLVVEKYE